MCASKPPIYWMNTLKKSFFGFLRIVDSCAFLEVKPKQRHFSISPKFVGQEEGFRVGDFTIPRRRSALLSLAPNLPSTHDIGSLTMVQAEVDLPEMTNTPSS